jgi:hypothetical protein
MAVGNAFDRLDPAYQDALFRSIDLCIDHAFADVAALLHDGTWDDLLFLNDALPDRPMYVQRYTPLLAKEFLVCLITVAGKLTSGADIRLASVAEEMALHALIENASGPSGQEEFDFDDFIDDVFEDTDFLFLFDEKLNGIQHVPAQQSLGTTNLDFENWFRPFRDAVPVHPYAGPDQDGVAVDRHSGSSDKSRRLN